MALRWDELNRWQKASRLTGTTLEWIVLLILLGMTCWIWVPAAFIYGLMMAGSVIYDFLNWLQMDDADEPKKAPTYEELRP